MQLKDLANLSKTLQILSKSVNIADTFNTLSLSMQKTVLASGQLNTEQLNLIATSNIFTKSVNGNKVSMSGLTLEEVKNAASTASLSTSQKATTGTTLGLGTAFKGLWISIKSATAAMWAFLTTNPLGWAVLAASTIAGLAFGVKKYNDSIEEAKETARERTSKLLDEFKEFNNTLAEHKKTVNELADKYDELSKGVNHSNNRNISLSTEEYDEFLNINKQLAESFPELAKGIDENGNSILVLGENGITAKEKLEELLQTEENLNNFRIAQGLGDAFKGVYTYVEDANEAADEFKGFINDSNKSMSKLQKMAENGIKLNGEYGQLLIEGSYLNEADVSYINALTHSVNEFWETLDPLRRGELSSNFGIDNLSIIRHEFDESTGALKLYADTYNLSSEEIEALEKIIEDNVKIANEAFKDSVGDQSQKFQDKMQQGKNAWRDFIPNLVSGMKSKQTFKDLDSDLQDIAIQIVEGLDYSYASAMIEYNPNDPYAYIRDKFIVPMGDISDDDKKDIKDAFIKLMKLDPEDISDKNREAITELVDTIATILEKDSPEIKIALGFDIGDDIIKNYKAAQKKALEKFSRVTASTYGNNAETDLYYEQMQEKIEKFARENSINTQDEIAFWNQCIEEATTLENAMNKYLNSPFGNQFSTLPLSITETIDQLNTNLKPTMDTLKSAYQDIFDDNGKANLDNIDILSTCDSIKSKLDEMSKLGLDIDYSAYEDFVRVLSDSEAETSDVHGAFNQLATAIAQVGLSGTEDFETLKAALGDLGVSNNDIVALQELCQNTEALKNAGLDLAKSTRKRY